MKIEHNSALVKEFAERILGHHYKTTTEGRKGFHRSDAISCPLRCYHRLVGDIKPEFRSRDVGVLMVGTMAHKILEEGFDAQEKDFELAGIHVIVDALAGKYPVEIKTTRKRIYRKEDIPRDWIEQLAIGMGVMNVERGYLMIINIINFSLTVWEFTMNEEERELTRHAFLWQILNIADAVEKRNPSLLKPRYEDCEWCVYRPSKMNQNCIYYKKIEKGKSGY
jgi:hypothetical protein